MRYEYNMDKDWHFMRGDGDAENLTSHAAAYSAVKAGGMGGMASPDFNDSEWETVCLPHDYLLSAGFSPDEMLSHGYKIRDNAWYRKAFHLPEEYRNRHLMLVFDGISVKAEIYFNGSLIARSQSGYLPIFADISDRAHFGDGLNTVAVYVDGKSIAGWWYEGAGIYRHVHLFVKESLHIAEDGIFVSPACLSEDRNLWDVTVSADTENSGYTDEKCKIVAEIFDGEKTVARVEGLLSDAPRVSRNTLSVAMKVENPSRWDVKTPYLYRGVVSLYAEDGTLLDKAETKFGFRTFRIEAGKGAFLNNKPIFLFGTCNHQDHACLGVALPDRIQRHRIQLLKDMGTNAYRMSHNPPAKELLDACDELGMLVMDENRRFESSPEGIKEVEALIRRDRNHPSVIMWSLFNEEPLQGEEEGKNIFKRLRAAVEKLDTTRCITGAMNGGYFEKDGVAPETDATGINYAINDDWPLCDVYQKEYPDRPVYGSETHSAVAVRGCVKTDKGKHLLSDYDENAMPWGASVRRMWRFCKTHPAYAGEFIWTGFDYRGEPSPFTYPTVTSLFGNMDLCGFPKEGYYQNKIANANEPMIHIFPYWDFTPGEDVRVTVYSNCDEAELFLNGESIIRKDINPGAPIDVNLAFAPGTLSAVGYRNGVPVVRDSRITPGKAYRIVAEPMCKALNGDGEDTMLISYHAEDVNGNVVDRASNLLSFTLAGDGCLVGVGNGDPNSVESEVAPYRHLYMGYAQIAVKAREGGKILTVKAESDGLVSAVTEIPVLPLSDNQSVPYLESASEHYLGNVRVLFEEVKEEPDALMTIADCDMNSYCRVTFNNCDYLPWTAAGWQFVAAVLDAPKAYSDTFTGYGCFVIRDLAAAPAKIYVNGKKATEITQTSGKVRIPFTCAPGEKISLRMTFAVGPGVPHAGIKSGIMFEFS